MKKGMYKIFVFISCFCLCMSFFIVHVKADNDYEFYYPDPDSYMAYDYFINHGYSNLMLSSTGSDNITYNVNLTNDNDLNQDNSDKGNISGQEHTTGTVGTNGSATLGSKYMTCTTNNNVSGTQTYTCYFSSSSYSVNNSQTINLQMNENTYTSVNNTLDIGHIDETGTTKGTVSASVAYANRLYAKIPFLSGTYNHPSSYSSNDFFNTRKGNSFYLIFMTKRLVSPTYNAYGQNGNTDFTVVPSRASLTNGWVLYIYRIDSDVSGGVNLTLDIDWLNSEDVIPVYCGRESLLTDSIRERIGMKTKLMTVLEDGNENTSSSVSNASNANNQVSQKIGEFDSIENNSVNDMNTNISNLNLTSDILNNSKFLSSASWVKTQFDRMTVSTPIGSVLSFSLILGMTLIFLGKIR